MSARLRAARAFTFEARAAIQLPTPSGARATRLAAGAIAVRRPDGLAVWW